MGRPMSVLGVGIIGCGNISAAYLRLAPMFGGFAIRAVADQNPEAAAVRAAEFNVSALSVDQLLAQDDIAVVVNLTVPSAHFEVTRRILEAGKHAYSEKPLVLSMDEGQVLRDLSAQKGLRVGSAPDTFLGGTHQHARAMIDDGGIGRVVSGTTHVMSAGMEDWHPNPDFFFQPGAGPVLDIGPYYITNLVQLLGPVKRLCALSSMASETRTITSAPRRGEVIPVATPTTLHAVLEFASGALITLGASWDVKAHRHAPMELYGTEGTLFLPDPNFFGGALEIATAEGDVSTVKPWAHPFGVANEGGAGGRANYRTAGLADMVDAVQAGRPHRCSLDLALHVVEVMTSILTSGESGVFIDMKTSCTRPAALTPDEAQTLLGAR
ncbi:MAG: Gfo/Idh/MocA family oxidoreductase [Pseudomonadota bacterium]